jgi:hypothetical protein
MNITENTTHSPQKSEEKQTLNRTANEDVEKSFAESLTQVAVHYNLFYLDGKPRKAQIIETIA